MPRPLWQRIVLLPFLIVMLAVVVAMMPLLIVVELIVSFFDDRIPFTPEPRS